MKKLIAHILVFALLLTSAVPAFAARDTDWFEDQEHTDKSFSDLEFVLPDAEAEIAKMDALLATAQDAANAEAVLDGYLEILEVVKTALTMSSLSNIYLSMDANDEEAFDNNEKAEKARLDIADAFLAVTRDLLASPCGEIFTRIMTEEEIEYYSEYEELTEEQKEIQAELTKLENDFWKLDGQDLTELTAASKKGRVYLKIMELNKRYAEIEGYDSYADYAYESVFGRDFTPEDSEAFAEAVKEYIVPVMREFDKVFYSLRYDGFYFDDWSGDKALDAMEPYIAALSDEMLESFTYMREHGFYDNYISAKKNGQGYTTMLYSYGAPFFFNSSDGTFEDLCTAVHEFGHYNNMYWQDYGVMLNDKTIDIDEVHSQGLELLFAENYDEILGDKDRGYAAKFYVVYNIVYSIITGAMVDELERYAYSQEKVTVADLNRKCTELAVEYGLVESADEGLVTFWAGIPHIYVSPFYYISYAVSAAGAFAFWLEAQEDYWSGIDSYLQFTSLSTEYGFDESFFEVGVENPLSEAYLAALAAALRYEMGFMDWYFEDVSTADWCFDAVMWAAEGGLAEADENGAFGAGEELTPETASELLGVSVTDVTRLGIITALYERSGAPAVTEAAPFRDMGGRTVSEKAAVSWAWEQGITSGVGYDLFAPDAVCTKGMLVTMLYRAENEN